MPYNEDQVSTMTKSCTEQGRDDPLCQQKAMCLKSKVKDA